MPAYAESVCTFNPHTLVAGDVAAERLEYLYPETGEVVSVPNVWFNQTYTLRAEALKDEAVSLLIQADELLRDGFLAKAESLRETAGYREAAARWMLMMGNPQYPVACVR
ncbi:uncharacterized protein NMK_2178 [Novimethylophilus kurashikiensis]|uniref:Uncharacterized protein n=1 Tax=Novimethylophilus kurashikiensis TaxID=1825523 RepID=A0A2R5F9T2_9PROT|nr:hypothetical protein [Novimethylophilus kurashikiensis]GBG14579.1 uncharacterized protein NMK_2178 [Novimethylophilus kurashikiensis]